MAEKEEKRRKWPGNNGEGHKKIENPKIKKNLKNKKDMENIQIRKNTHVRAASVSATL